MNMLRVLSRHGDNRYLWDSDRVHAGDPEALAAIREAERIFAETRAHGGSAFLVRQGQPTMRIDAFDPEAEQIIMTPRVVGG